MRIFFTPTAAFGIQSVAIVQRGITRAATFGHESQEIEIDDAWALQLCGAYPDNFAPYPVGDDGAEKGPKGKPKPTDAEPGEGTTKLAPSPPNPTAGKVG
jgi:hypothetical protein